MSGTGGEGYEVMCHLVQGSIRQSIKRGVCCLTEWRDNLSDDSVFISNTLDKLTTVQAMGSCKWLGRSQQDMAVLSIQSQYLK